MKMRMIHLICRHMRLDRIRNIVIRNKIGVTSIEDKHIGTGLRWLGHITRSIYDALVRRCEKIVLLGCRRG